MTELDQPTPEMPVAKLGEVQEQVGTDKKRYMLGDLVKLRKCDLKNAKKKNKLY